MSAESTYPNQAHVWKQAVANGGAKLSFASPGAATNFAQMLNRFRKKLRDEQGGATIYDPWKVRREGVFVLLELPTMEGVEITKLDGEPLVEGQAEALQELFGEKG